jgi:hypothetical protein
MNNHYVVPEFFRAVKNIWDPGFGVIKIVFVIIQIWRYLLLDPKSSLERHINKNLSAGRIPFSTFF